MKNNRTNKKHNNKYNVRIEQNRNWIYVFSFLFSLILFFTILDGGFHTDNNYLMQYTTWANIFSCTWLFMVSLMFFIKNERYIKIISNKTLIYTLLSVVTVTFIVVLFILFPFYEGKWFTNGIDEHALFTHALTPIAIWIIGYSIKQYGNFNWKYAFITLSYSITYLVIILVVVKVDDRDCPYDFIDINWYDGKYYIFIPAIIGITIVFYGITMGLYALEKLIAKYKHSKIKNGH